MKKDPRILLQHVRESIDLIFDYIDGVSESKFKEDQSIQDAVLRRIEIIGEAVKGLPEDFRKLNPDIPWSKIAGTRDFVIHEYFSIDTDLVWEIIQKDLPDLRRKIEPLI